MKEMIGNKEEEDDGIKKDDSITILINISAVVLVAVYFIMICVMM